MSYSLIGLHAFENGHITNYLWNFCKKAKFKITNKSLKNGNLNYCKSAVPKICFNTFYKRNLHIGMYLMQLQYLTISYNFMLRFTKTNLMSLMLRNKNSKERITRKMLQE